MEVYIIIPARYQSTRLPGKMLLTLGGKNNKPIIQHVYEQASKSHANDVIIATDNKEIVDTCTAFGAKIYMTKSSHKSGTERIAEVIELHNIQDEDIIINIQGDEPFISPTIIDQLIDNIKQTELKCATLCEPISSAKQLFDPHITKVIANNKNEAIYFSRAPIPWDRERFNSEQKGLSKNFTYMRHIGIYAYRADFVKRYVNWEPSPLEQIESLEQLRILWHGEKIHVEEAKGQSGLGIDTKHDLEKARLMVAEKL